MHPYYPFIVTAILWKIAKAPRLLILTQIIANPNIMDILHANGIHHTFIEAAIPIGSNPEWNRLHTNGDFRCSSN